MYASANQAYLESRVLSAEPVELVRLLYQAATASVRDARRHLAAGEITGRSRAISKAVEIVIELSASLDRERGGELAARLFQLYEYIQRRLLEANFEQTDTPLVETLGLLATLSEAWDGVRQAAEPPPPQINPWTAPAAQEATAYAPHSWNG